MTDRTRCKEFAWLDYFSLAIGLSFTVCSLTSTVFVSIPTSREDHIIRKIALIIICVSSLFLACNLILSRYAKYEILSKKNTWINMTGMIGALTLLVAIIIQLVQIHQIQMPNVTEQLEKCQQVVSNKKQCRNKFSGDDYFKICDFIFESNKIEMTSYTPKHGGKSIAFGFSTDDKYCVRTREYKMQIGTAIISLATLLLYSIHQGIIFKQMMEVKKDARNELKYQRRNQPGMPIITL